MEWGFEIGKQIKKGSFALVFDGEMNESFKVPIEVALAAGADP